MLVRGRAGATANGRASTQQTAARTFTHTTVFRHSPRWMVPNSPCGGGERRECSRMGVIVGIGVVGNDAATASEPANLRRRRGGDGDVRTPSYLSECGGVVREVRLCDDHAG